MNFTSYKGLQHLKHEIASVICWNISHPAWPSGRGLGQRWPEGICLCYFFCITHFWVFFFFFKELNSGDGEGYNCSLHECYQIVLFLFEPRFLELLANQAWDGQGLPDLEKQSGCHRSRAGGRSRAEGASGIQISWAMGAAARAGRAGAAS